jgi:uncharacterized membrane protein
MGKTDYLEALKRAMTGLPPEAQAKTLAFYEQRFVDGVSAGRSEEDVAAEQDDPRKIAMTLRANTHMQAFEQKKSPASFARMAVAAVGLAIFNLFMVVPAMVYASLLTALYVCGLVLYLGGAVVTAGGLSGSNEFRLDGPFRNFMISDNGIEHRKDMQTKVEISENGIQIFSEREKEGGEGGDTSSTTITVGEPAIDAPHTDGDKPAVRAIKRAESVAADGIVFSSDDEDSQATQIFAGIGMILGGIILILLSLVVTRYTFIGIKRYIDMNLSLLRGN